MSTSSPRSESRELFSYGEGGKHKVPVGIVAGVWTYADYYTACRTTSIPNPVGTQTPPYRHTYMYLTMYLRSPNRIATQISVANEVMLVREAIWVKSNV